jgi:hypothetical protein
MSHLLIFLLAFATAVHSVFGCCWHHALMPGGAHGQSKQVAADHCSCHRHAHLDSPTVATRHGSASDRAAADHEQPASQPSDQPRRDHPCHNSKCVSLLTEKAPDFSRADRLPSVNEVPVVVAEVAVSVALASSRELGLDFQPVRPVRAHLFLGVLLI